MIKGKIIEPLLIPGLRQGRDFDFNYFDLFLLLVIRIFNCFAHNGFAFKNLRGHASFSRVIQ